MEEEVRTEGLKASYSRSRPKAGTDWTVGVCGGLQVRALGQTTSVQSVPALGLLRVASLNRVAGARLRQPVAECSKRISEGAV